MPMRTSCRRPREVPARRPCSRERGSAVQHRSMRERLGRIGSALASYEVAAQRAQHEPHGETILRMARAASEPLRTRAPRLTLMTSPSHPKDLVVSLDGSPVPAASLGVALPVDPGDHVVDADAPGHLRRHWAIALSEGRAERIDVVLGDRIPDATPSPAIEEPGALGHDEEHGRCNPQRHPSWWTTRRMVGAGASGSGPWQPWSRSCSWRATTAPVNDLREACQRGCPEARRDELAATRGTAVRDQTLAVTAGVVAGAALVTGAVLLLWPKPQSGAAQREGVLLTATPSGMSVAGRS